METWAPGTALHPENGGAVCLEARGEGCCPSFILLSVPHLRATAGCPEVPPGPQGLVMTPQSQPLRVLGPGWSPGFRSASLVGPLLGSDKRGAHGSVRATLDPRALY